MNWSWKDWLSILTIIAVVYGGVAWAYKRIKELIKFLEQVESNKSEIAKLNKRADFISGKVDGVIILLNEAFFVCNEEGLCILSNEYLCNLFGSTHEQMAGSGWINFIIPEDRESAWKQWSGGIKSGVKFMTGSYRILHGKTKEIIPIEYNATVYREENDEVVIVSVGKAHKA
jgi:PAS domain S-box-containing protein